MARAGPAQTPLPAPDSLSADSLSARLARAEAAIALLRAQVAQESQTTVHTRSRLQVELSGRLQTNAFWTLGRANSVDVPGAALAPADLPAPDAFGATVRQTRLGAFASLQDVLGATFLADLDVDFAGGVSSAPGDRRLFPEPRLRTTRMILQWPRTELMVGSDVPVISELNPVSLAASAIPAFSGAGNLWNWLAQARLAQELAAVRWGSAELRFGAQVALLAPYAAVVAAGEPDGVDAGERSTRPALEGRLRVRWGDPTASGATDASIAHEGGEIGISAHRGWVAAERNALTTSRAVALDARISLSPRLEVRGEGYAGGRLLRGLGGGAIGQAFGRAPAGAAQGAPVRDAAGWIQANVEVHPTTLVGAGCGLDVVDGADRPVRTRNAVCMTHLLWRPNGPLVIGAEYRRLRTHFDTGSVGRAQHVNLSLGVEL